MHFSAPDALDPVQAVSPSILAPLLEHLSRRSSFTSAEADALLALPVRLARPGPGAYLVREGDASSHYCVLLSGFAYSTGEGARQILAVHIKGDLIGWDGGLLECADFSAQVLSPATVAYIPRQAIVDLTLAHPNIGRALWRELLVDASVAREWIVNVGQRSARQRIAHLLCEVKVRQERGAGDPQPVVDWPLTQEQLGDATGLTAVHVNRTMQGMRGAGLIRTARHSVTVLDWNALQAEGDFSRAYLHLPATHATLM